MVYKQLIKMVVHHFVSERNMSTSTAWTVMNFLMSHWLFLECLWELTCDSNYCTDFNLLEQQFVLVLASYIFIQWLILMFCLICWENTTLSKNWTKKRNEMNYTYRYTIVLVNVQFWLADFWFIIWFIQTPMELLR